MIILLSFSSAVIADGLSQDQQVRMKRLGLSTEKFKKELIEFYSLTDDYTFKDIDPENINYYLMVKENRIKRQIEEKQQAIKDIEFEKVAKIQTGKQYVCSDGHDSWVLKYNGKLFTFGEVNFDSYRNSHVIKIDRALGTVTYNGNKSTCKPR